LVLKRRLFLIRRASGFSPAMLGIGPHEFLKPTQNRT
jgi:hypothetical protein